MKITTRYHVICNTNWQYACIILTVTYLCFPIPTSTFRSWKWGCFCILEIFVFFWDIFYYIHSLKRECICLLVRFCQSRFNFDSLFQVDSILYTLDIRCHFCNSLLFSWRWCWARYNVISNLLCFFITVHIIKISLGRVFNSFFSILLFLTLMRGRKSWWRWRRWWLYPWNSLELLLKRWLWCWG